MLIPWKRIDSNNYITHSQEGVYTSSFVTTEQEENPSTLYQGYQRNLSMWALACSHRVSIPCQTKSTGALPELSLIHRSVKLSLQIPVKFTLKKLWRLVDLHHPRLLYFHKIWYSYNQTKLLKGQSKKKLCLHLLSLVTKFRAKHLSGTSRCPKTLDKTNTIHVQFTCITSVMYPGHIRHARQLIWAWPGHLLRA